MTGGSRHRLVGRARPLRELEAALRDAVAGRGALALVTGEAGIGKSRLAAELAARAPTLGARVVWASCWDGGGAPAYWPWVQALRAPGDELERLNYGWSALHCLPSGMVQQPSAGTGTVMRPTTLRRYAVQAGFAGVEVLPIDHDFWRFYGLVG
jgi:hypothetical protein